MFIFDRQGTLIFAPGGRTEVMRAAGQRLPEGIQINNNRDGGGGGNTQTTVARWQDGKRYLTAATQLQPRYAASDLGWRIAPAGSGAVVRLGARSLWRCCLTPT